MNNGHHQFTGASRGNEQPEEQVLTAAKPPPELGAQGVNRERPEEVAGSKGNSMLPMPIARQRSREQLTSISAHRPKSFQTNSREVESSSEPEISHNSGTDASLVDALGADVAGYSPGTAQVVARVQRLRQQLQSMASESQPAAPAKLPAPGQKAHGKDRKNGFSVRDVVRHLPTPILHHAHFPSLN
jgi:hypothetical protein